MPAFSVKSEAEKMSKPAPACDKAETAHCRVVEVGDKHQFGQCLVERSRVRCLYALRHGKWIYCLHPRWKEFVTRTLRQLKSAPPKD